MPLRLREEVVTQRVLAEMGQNHCQIARTVGGTEGTVRYHLSRAVEGAVAGGRAAAPAPAKEEVQQSQPAGGRRGGLPAPEPAGGESLLRLVSYRY